MSILNQNGEGMKKDAIFGELMNTGREDADSIEVLMSWADGQEVRTSPKYTYGSLKPGEKVAFALDYEVSEGVALLSYTITVTAFGRGTKLKIPPEKGTVSIVSPKNVDFRTDLYNSDSPAEFTFENGEIVCSGFYGRESQLAELRGCVEGSSFREYKNRVVQGVRRSGKTSPLNYLRTYCTFHRPEIIVRYVDCQGITHQPLQTVFIKSVLDILPGKIPGLEGQPCWEKFQEDWSLHRDEPDRLQQEISDFYNALDALLDRLAAEGAAERKGVLLIIDEFDVLLQKLGEESADDLLQTLRKVMSQCGSVVKLVFCGSNNLILYKMNGGRYNQFFQSVQVIVVDDLPMTDLEDMLRRPYEGTDVSISAETMDWIYRYTGGLVWYTKLLGKAMLERAKAAGRTAVYPTDVYAAFTEICSDGNCQQFYEGCGDEEVRVLRALAELSPRYRSVVSTDALRANLDGELTEIRLIGALNRLAELRLIESTAGRHFFRKEIYRRYFRTKLAISGSSAGDILEKAVRVSVQNDYGGFGRKK